MNSNNPLADLIRSAQELNGWSDRDLGKRAESLGLDITTSNFSRLKNRELVSVKGSLIKTLSRVLKVSEAKVAHAALASMGVEISYDELTVDDAVRNSTDFSARDRRIIQSVMDAMRDERSETVHDDQEQPETNPSGERVAGEGGAGGGVGVGEKTEAVGAWRHALAAFLSADVRNRAAWRDDFSAADGVEHSLFPGSLDRVILTLPGRGRATHLDVMRRPETAEALATVLGFPEPDAGDILSEVRAQLAHDWLYADARLDPEGNAEGVASWESYVDRLMEDADETDSDEMPPVHELAAHHNFKRDRDRFDEAHGNAGEESQLGPDQD
ncbi:hypothetical protein [Arthrobacter sp. JSM 101049]|uniref:hypothetical protein n=1 Tax=Arthrobacter sp. JSM 101049 TaxID=929097 RepID=UPI00356512D0